MGVTAKGAALRTIVNQVRVLFHKFAHAAAQIHGTDLMAIGKRAILEDLLKNGPQTIPQLARKRPVTRQHILSLVNPLKEEGRVEFRENPAHKRSFLVSLTGPGKKLIENMIAREDVVFNQLAESLKLQEVNRTIETLKTIQNLLESEKFKESLKGGKR